MLTSSPLVSPDLARHASKPVVATPQTSQTLSKSHRLLRPLKSKLVSLRQFHESNPSLTRVETIWSIHSWPPSTRNTTKSYSGRRKRTRSANGTGDDDGRAVWEDVKFTDVDALKFAKGCVGSVSIANMFGTLHSSYRVFMQQFQSGCSLGTLGAVATYTLGTWTYMYEQQSSAQHNETPSDEYALTLDDVLLEYLPPTHPHLPLLLGYAVALLTDYKAVIRHLLPSLILLTVPVSPRATIELARALFSVAASGWEDFTLCMTISRLIGREDEYLFWLSQNMTLSFIQAGGLGHLLRLGRDYPSFAATVVRAVKLCIPRKRTPIDADLEAIITELVQLICIYSLQSSCRDLISLAKLLPPQHTSLPSLALLVHLTLKSSYPDYSTTPLLPFTKRNLTFSPLRHVFPQPTLRTHITTLLGTPALVSLGIALARDWKDHVDYDGDSEDLESTWEFLERVEREYLEETEGVKWRFEDVLAEWIGEWPDGRELGSSKIPRRRYPEKEGNDIIEEDVNEENNVVDEEEEEFGGSLIKKFIPRSGLVLDTPVMAKRVDPKTERKIVLERLFKLSSIGRTVRRARYKPVEVDIEGEGGESFLERLGQSQKMEDDEQREVTYKSPRKVGSRKKRIDSDTEESDPADNDVESQSSPSIPRRKRRKIGDSDTDGSSYHGSNLENQSLQSDSDDELVSSEPDELSISLEPTRSALGKITINHKSTKSRHNSGRTNKMLVRESSPVLLEDVSDDELGM